MGVKAELEKAVKMIDEMTSSRMDIFEGLGLVKNANTHLSWAEFYSKTADNKLSPEIAKLRETVKAKEAYFQFLQQDYFHQPGMRVTS